MSCLRRSIPSALIDSKYSSCTFSGGGFRITCSCVCLYSRFGLSPYLPSAGLREGCTYAVLYGFGPSTRRNVSGAMVPAPTSTSYGCCNTHPRSAQNFCSDRISSWNVGASCFIAVSIDPVQHGRRHQFLFRQLLDALDRKLPQVRAPLPW